MKSTVFTVLFFAAGLIFILLQYIPADFPELPFKAALMPLLIIVFLVAGSKNVPVWPVILALLFSLAGDVILEFADSHENLFVVGLLCFMITQIIYLILFYRKGTLKKTGIYIGIVFLYGILLVAFLYNDLNEMRIPVMVYAAVILSMLSAAITRVNSVSLPGFLLVLSGAVLFVLSDSMIAVNKFSFAFTGAPALIMITYILGQYLIIKGLIKS
jgi:uncharacterized membrane protein YhhN